MPCLRLIGALGSLEFEIPLESLVVITSPGGDEASRLVFGLIAAEAQRQMAPLLSPTWLPAVGRLATRESGSVEGLRPTFVFRHEDATWPDGSRVGDVLGILPLFERALGCLQPGSCEACNGAGERAEVALEALITDPKRSLAAGAIGPWAKRNSKFHLGVLESLAARIGLDMQRPWASLGQAMQEVVLHGCPESNYKGVVHDVEWRIRKAGEGRGQESLADLSKYIAWRDCIECGRTGLDGPTRSSAKGGVNLARLHQTPLAELPRHIAAISETQGAAEAKRFRSQCAKRLRIAHSLGLASELLGGRAARLKPDAARQLRLGEVLGSDLQSAIYTLQAPLFGLSGEVRKGTLRLIRERVAQGDSILMVDEHPDASAAADVEFVLQTASETGCIELRTHESSEDSE